MSNSYWNLERWRIILVLFIAILGGMLSGYWLLSLILTLVGYIVWLLHKVYQLDRWLTHNARDLYLPEGDGVWQQIISQIQGLQKKSDVRKKRMSKLLKRFQGIITGLPYTTIVLNANNEIDWANKPSAKLLNIDIKKDRGQRIDNLIRLPALYKILAKNSHKEIEISLPQGDGKNLALQLITVQKDLKLLIVRDISERVNIQQMRKNFIANASHELYTPLTVIVGYLEIMQEDVNLPASLKKAVDSATEQSSRMQQIIEGLLALSKLENSELDNASGVIVDVPTILQELCNDTFRLISNKSHTIKTDIDTRLKINGAEAEIISVCSNLIHNAIRHTQDGTHIIVKWKKTLTGEACLTVADDGPGIANEHICHLTERFYRADKGRVANKGGTGLGLAIVQHIIQRHGGRLDIQSTVGKGSSFSVCFPVERV